jgi:hypothetical protein
MIFSTKGFNVVIMLVGDKFGLTATLSLCLLVAGCFFGGPAGRDGAMRILRASLDIVL